MKLMSNLNYILARILIKLMRDTTVSFSGKKAVSENIVLKEIVKFMILALSKFYKILKFSPSLNHLSILSNFGRQYTNEEEDLQLLLLL